MENRTTQAVRPLEEPGRTVSKSIILNTIICYKIHHFKLKDSSHRGDASSAKTAVPPEDCPKTVTRFLSPPKDSMLSRTHLVAAKSSFFNSIIFIFDWRRVFSYVLNPL